MRGKRSCSAHEEIGDSGKFLVEYNVEGWTSANSFYACGLIFLWGGCRTRQIGKHAQNLQKQGDKFFWERKSKPHHSAVPNKRWIPFTTELGCYRMLTSSFCSFLNLVFNCNVLHERFDYFECISLPCGWTTWKESDCKSKGVVMRMFGEIGKLFSPRTFATLSLSLSFGKNTSINPSPPGLGIEELGEQVGRRKENVPVSRHSFCCVSA